ncbi:hypothetical protein INR49_023758 [Caranx melampygus]|nr:hypothetical protein INR49_023758 [Caranx melampygus]
MQLRTSQPPVKPLSQSVRTDEALRRPFKVKDAINFMISGLQDIEKCRQQLHEINVPLEVFEYIDQGRNPQLYTKECLERALARNEQVKGKIDTMTKFKSLLISELSKVFPEEMSKYKAIHGEDPPS